MREPVGAGLRASLDAERGSTHPGSVVAGPIADSDRLADRCGHDGRVRVGALWLSTDVARRMDRVPGVDGLGWDRLLVV
jgi:hypothetical protein